MQRGVGLLAVLHVYFTYGESGLTMEADVHRENKRNVCGPIADSYIRLASVYSAHPSCSPSVFFTHPGSKYTPLEKPLE